MTYVFVFLGEFGYELFNWQGVVRKFRRTLGPGDRIVCCGRRGLHLLYESADDYIDISELVAFKSSVASGYWAMRVPEELPLGGRGKAFERWLKWTIRIAVLRRLGWRRDVRFIFSSDRTVLNGGTFGADVRAFGVDQREGNIYEHLALSNNEYRRILPDLRVRRQIEERLGWSLSEPFVLCQARARKIVVRCEGKVPVNEIVGGLASKTRVVLLSFDTGRRFDSYSVFEDQPGCSIYTADDLTDQACLIHFAQRCLFFSEGDFGSHTYVPPFMGKDVFVVAPRTMYSLPTTPLDFWNRHVFQFGGQIVPIAAEDLGHSIAALDTLVQRVAS